ncbi:MAK10-like protein [Tanacetum coccineum]
MGDENPIRTLGDYSKPSHKGYRNTIEILIGNNVDPNQHLKDFLKLMDSLDIDGENKERTCLNAKLHNDILMFQQHHGESLSEAWTCFKDLLQNVPHHGIDLWLKVQIFYDHVNHVTRRTIDQLAGVVLTTLNIAWKISNKPLSNTHSRVPMKREAITDRIARALPSNMVKNPKLSTSPVLFTRSYPTIDPQCSSYPSTSINAIKAHSKEANISSTSLPQTGMGIETQQLEEPEPTLEDEFQDLHLNLPVLEVLAHTPIYNTILDKYMESLELSKNGSAFVQGEILAKMEDPRLFTLPCRLWDSEPFESLADLGSCVNIIPLYLFKKLNIRLLEETNHVFGLANGTKSYPVGIVKDVEVHIGILKHLNDFYMIDMKDPKTPLLVRRGFLATANAVIDCRMAKIAVGERITRSVFGVKGVDLGEEEAPYWTTLGKWESYKPQPRSDGIGEISRDVELNPFKDTLVFRRMVEFLGSIPINLKSNMWELEDLIKNLINWDKPPKNRDGVWHTKIRLIDLDGEEFTKTLQSIPTTKKPSERESLREIINLDHFYDT